LFLILNFSPSTDFSNTKKNIENEVSEDDFIEFISDEKKSQDELEFHGKKVNTNIKSDNYFLNDEKIYAPWISDSTMSIKNPNVRLHNELIEFTNYISPSKEDYNKRTNAIKR